MKPGKPVAGTFNWNKDGTELGFKPTQLLKFGAKYKAGVALTAQQHPGRARSATIAGNSSPSSPCRCPRSNSPTDPRASQRRPEGGTLQLHRPDDPADLHHRRHYRPAQADPGLHLLQRERNHLDLDFWPAPDTAYTVTLSGKLADPYGNTLGQDYVLHLPHTRRSDPPTQRSSASGHVQRLHRHPSGRALPQPAGGPLRPLLGDA